MKIYKYIQIVLLAFTSTISSWADDSSESAFDSLFEALNVPGIADTTRLSIYSTIAHDHSNIDTVKVFALKQIRLAQKLKNYGQEALGYSYLAWSELADVDSKGLVKANKYIYRSIAISDSIGDKAHVAYCYVLIGDSYTMTNDLTSANINYQKAIDIYTQLNDKRGMANTLIQMGQINYLNLMYDMAIECVTKAIGIYREIDDYEAVARGQSVLGNIHFLKYKNSEYTANDPDLLVKAKKYICESAPVLIKNPYWYNQLFCQTYIKILNSQAEITSDPYKKKQLLDSCKIVFDKARRYEDSLSLSFPYDDYCEWLIVSGQGDRAKCRLDTIMAAHGTDYDYFSDEDYRFYELYAKMLEDRGCFKDAIYYYHVFNELDRNRRRPDFVANAARNMAKNEFDQKMYEREIHFETETFKRNIAIVFISIFLIMSIALIFVVIRSYRRSLRQNTIISSVNKQLTDSINYASHIQKAVLPSKYQIDNIFKHNFIVYHPLNIVSGDFYWATQIGPIKMLAVADSTGHGVPGALLSMLGVSTLNDVAARIDPDNLSAGNILNDMRRAIKESLHQNNGFDETQDGMDIALIAIDTRSLVMHYAGAFRPVIVVRDDRYFKFNPDRMPIGSHSNDSSPFTSQSFQLAANDKIYLFSDGVTDQFGFDKDGRVRKFAANRFYELILRISGLPSEEQKQQIEDAITQWRTTPMTGELYEQTDDTLIVGVEI
ncbi:MAG: SpoIIE family protein phosphatase [Bacteroidales bacterium]|nr:SpoIIE family protein phosphatase [Bacteroidales bacterium]